MANKPIKKKLFDISSSQEYEQAVENFASKAAKVMTTTGELGDEEWKTLMSIRNHAMKQHDYNFLSNPPNDQCSHAIISGILVENTFETKQLEFNHLLDTPFESIFIWAAKENQYSYMISNVKMNVHQRNVWHTFSQILKYTVAFISLFEHNLEVDYWWIYRFKPTIKWEKQEFIDNEAPDLRDTTYPLQFFKDNVALIDLLKSDNKFYHAVQNLIAAFNAHSFCLICSYSKEGHKKHLHHEPHIWEYSSLIPQMEIAIVSATKAVEGILGQQGANKGNALKKWQDNIEIKADSLFGNTGMTYFEFHAYMIDKIRNRVAHNITDKPFAVSREITINLQIFAWEIVRSYYLKFRKNDNDASESLKLNLNFISK